MKSARYLHFEILQSKTINYIEKSIWDGCVCINTPYVYYMCDHFDWMNSRRDPIRFNFHWYMEILWKQMAKIFDSSRNKLVECGKYSKIFCIHLWKYCNPKNETEFDSVWNEHKSSYSLHSNGIFSKNRTIASSSSKMSGTS